MGNGRSPSRGGIYAGFAAMAVTVGLGVVGAAGADQAATADVYARDDAGGTPRCFSTDPDAEQCATDETATVTINTGDTVTWHFERASATHNVADAATPPTWSSRYPTTTTYSRTFNEPGDYAFVCQAHLEMEGTVTVVGDPIPTETGTATATATATATPSTQPSGPTTPPPSGSSDSVKPTVASLRPTALRRAVRVRFTLSEPATVTVRVKRGRKVIQSKRVQAGAGTRSVTLRSKRLKKGRYTVEIEARDASGNRSRLATKRVKLRK